MTGINKLNIFQTLMADTKFIHSGRAASLVSNALMKEEWITSLPEAKQVRRKQFLASGKKVKSVINLEYYEKMIVFYDLIIEILANLNMMIDNMEFKEDNILLLHLTALILIEQGFIDEYILPYKHISPVYFQNISDEINSTYPELMINDFVNKYVEMYDIWPDKSKYEIQTK